MLFLIIALPICFWVAISDMKHMKIPNLAVLALAGGFLLTGPFVLPLDAYMMRIAAGVAVLALGFLVNQLRLVGAGDAKFAAAMAPFFSGADLAIVLMLFSFMLLMAFASHRTLRAIPAVRGLAPDWASWTSPKFPMGLALSSTLATYLGLVAYFS
jgi:prepilin peptidase CpaA